MKRNKYLFLVLCLMLIPILNIKATEKTNEEVIKEETNEQLNKLHIVSGDTVTSSSNVDGSSVVAGSNVTSENTVKGLDMVFGQTVTYNGNSDYSIVAGDTVNINGITKNDGFIFGNAITFNKSYIASRDLVVFGNSIILRGEIKRDVTIFASSVILEDLVINGNIKINASNIDVKNVTVSGTFSYDEDALITISEDAIINEKNTIISNSDIQNPLANIVNYVSVLVLFAFIAIILPNMFKKIENKTKDISITKFISMLGYGLLFLIIIPFVSVLLLIIPITQLVGLLLLGVYIVVICAHNIFAGYLIGLLIWKKFIKKDINILLVGLIGISVLKVLSFIPYVNVITTLISILLSLNIFIKLFSKDA